jgi:hypothetical protein
MKSFAAANDIAFSDSDCLRNIAWVDFSSVALDGKLANGKHAPQLELVKSQHYCDLKERQVKSIIDTMRARNGGESVFVLSMCPEMTDSILPRLNADAPEIAGVGSTRHLMQFGNFLRQSGTENEQSAERAIWDEALNLAALYAFHGHDVLTNPRIQSITPWANLVASGKSCSPDEQLQYCFGGAAGADPSDAGLLPFAFVLYLLPYV